MIFSHFLIQILLILVFGTFCSIQDIKTKKVSNLLIFSGWLLQLIFLIFTKGLSMYVNLMCANFTLIFYFFVRLISKSKLGAADALFGFFQGLFLSPVMICFCILTECLLALGGFGIMKIKRTESESSVESEPKHSLPFIPFMAASLLITFVLESFFC